MQVKEVHELIVKLTLADRITLVIRDKLYGSSWSKMLKDIQKRGVKEQIEKDIPIVKRLMAVEQKYNIKLRDPDLEADKKIKEKNRGGVK